MVDGKTLVSLKVQDLPDNAVDEDEEARKLLAQKCLVVKDEGMISDEAYHELHMISGVGLPPLSHLKAEKKEQSRIIDVKKIEKVNI